MKRIILLLIGLSFCGLSSFNAQSLAGYKISIDPGHGGYDSNDRFIPETGYWESEGNLTKGLYLKSILESLGATVFITRSGNNTSDDLPLSQRAEIANSNNVDYFHSIHSNATGTDTKANYTLILYHGYDQAPTFPQSKEMGAILVSKIRAVNRTTDEYNRGDFSFYGNTSGLGVLRPLSMPGTLSEGSFHDYIPESWRLKNDSYLKHEAWAIARAFLQYFKGGEFQNGILAGIVRDELETVPASYKPISGTNDNYKPINKMLVKLVPGGKIYTGDEFNNGYYFFDKLSPGNYKLFFESERFKTDSVSVIVKANESFFSDKLMVLKPILDPPTIVNYSPADSINEVSNITDIVLEFSIRMNVTETQKAITISPSVAGNFKWENDYRRVIFTPTKSYVPGMKYTVSISTSAKTYFDVNLQQEKSFSFTTRSKLNLIYTYPLAGAADISTSVLMSIRFDKGIDASTLGGKILFTDSDGNPVGVSVNQSRYNVGIIDFEPKLPLSNHSIYRITLREGIGDIEYVTFPKQVVIEFRTEKSYTFTGNIIEGFEQENVWQSPLLSPNTKGIIQSQTNFTITKERKKSGDNSGKLEYGFSGNDGLVELALLNPIEFVESSPAGFGLWVFGDNSKNILEYRFLRQNSNEEKLKIDTINWTGWKLKKILLNGIPGTGKIQFKSIDIVQTGSGISNGKIFFDELISNIITGVDDNNNLSTEFRLEQNYPNPFNPTTTIRFSIPNVKTGHALSMQRISLKVYDLLGREVATLVDEYKQAGTYSVDFNVETRHSAAGGSSLPSGVYFYTLKAGNYFQTKKMLLLK